MRRRYKSDFDSYQSEDKYKEAERKVKKLKGFYTHLIVYILVNILIVFININDLSAGESYFKMENFFTAFFWGIGLLAHGLSTFMPHWIFGKNWEDKKIKEFMEKEKQNNTNWE
ncbi:2TM domain-containing protein [Flavobacterium sp. W1B]|uniref:2TM domain-containing protein n=1 Tax=Flavobacterium sp. W1B TaxID=3394146 RepID=UPI0039BC569A